jgi:hypothetical protein
MRDVAMLLMHAGTAVGDSLPGEVKGKCVVGSLLGRTDELERFVRQSYLRVSRQTGGATSNELGHIVQNSVYQHLRRRLPGWQITLDGNIPGMSANDGKTQMTFDVVARSPDHQWFGIEVSFQVTTNSVIERKAGQAQARYQQLRRAGHRICYVIDGAGNINGRVSAVADICRYSDCTVAFSPEEMDVLAAFLREASAGSTG